MHEVVLEWSLSLNLSVHKKSGCTAACQTATAVLWMGRSLADWAVCKTCFICDFCGRLRCIRSLVRTRENCSRVCLDKGVCHPTEIPKEDIFWGPLTQRNLKPATGSLLKAYSRSTMTNSKLEEILLSGIDFRSWLSSVQLSITTRTGIWWSKYLWVFLMPYFFHKATHGFVVYSMTISQGEKNMQSLRHCKRCGYHKCRRLQCLPAFMETQFTAIFLWVAMCQYWREHLKIVVLQSFYPQRPNKRLIVSLLMTCPQGWTCPKFRLKVTTRLNMIYSQMSQQPGPVTD